ncbi:MAG: FG-GAP-like repeat-containing protein, partial [Gemmatimonadota bacterium]|nr:FG-GAP-like repeat-containing protein [Gemmatimonadota bacterium]
MTFSASRSLTGSEPPATRPARFWFTGLVAAAVGTVGCGNSGDRTPRDGVEAQPVFSRVQPELFDEPGAQPNAWADYDGDGDLDLFVGMRYGPNHLYRNDGGTFEDVAEAVGLADVEDTRAA